MSELSTEIRSIADQIDRWARYDDVPAPGLGVVQTLHRAAATLAVTTSILNEAGCPGDLETALRAYMDAYGTLEEAFRPASPPPEEEK